MSLLPNIKLDDIPVESATPLNGLAIAGKLSTREISNGYVQVTLPLYYVPGNGGENGVAETDYHTLSTTAESVSDADSAKAAGLRTFQARWNLKSEWFTPEFTQAVRAGTVDGTEKTMYQINVAGITRGLFRAAGLASLDFDSFPEGSVIGFKAAPGKKEPDRNQIRLFYPPKRS